MIRKIVPLLAATFLSITWASGSAAATSDNDRAAALSNTVAVAATAPGKSPNSSQCKKDKGLFDRLGGFFGIAAVVNRFSDQILVNPVLNQNPALAAWNQNEAPTRLPGLKFGRTMWIAAMVGGPIKYTGLPLEQAHDRFNMTQAEFAEVGSEIVEALQFFNVAQADIDQVVCIYGTSMNEVTSSLEPRAVTPPR
ncbi:MAG TPA: group 1 truncated hemoglobin [Sphingomicrobium sp.]|nr:group 1 truncated hemoglobin [Sphingomicrobium sp.]